MFWIADTRLTGSEPVGRISCKIGLIRTLVDRAYMINKSILSSHLIRMMSKSSHTHTHTHTDTNSMCRSMCYCIGYAVHQAFIHVYIVIVE